MEPYQKSLELAKVDNKEIFVEDGTTARELISEVGEDSDTKSLVQIAPNGDSKILRSVDRINFKDGRTLVVTINATEG